MNATAEIAVAAAALVVDEGMDYATAKRKAIDRAHKQKRE